MAPFQQHRTLREQGTQLRILRDQERDRQEDRRTEQARLVAAWPVGFAAKPATAYQGIDGVVEKWVVRGAVENRSDEPVWSVCVRARSAWEHYDMRHSRLRVLPPGEKREIEIEIELPPSWDGAEITVDVTFTDAAGRHWRRRDNGLLEEARADRPPESAWPDY
jgi:hypothetical protein